MENTWINRQLLMFEVNETTSDNISSIIERFIDTYPVEEWKTFGLLSENFISKINIHWLKFPPPNKWNHYILAVIYLIIMIIGISGNALVVYMLIRCKSLRTPANILVMNLAISDFLMMSKMSIFIFNSVALGPALGEIACRIYGFIGGLSGTVSICTLAAISLDRYYVIKYPLKMGSTQQRARLCVVFVWIYGVTFSSIPLLDFGLGSYIPEGYLTSCSFDYLTPSKKIKIFIFIFFIAAWVIPFTVILFCYTNILYVVIRKRHLSGKHMERNDRHVKIEDEKSQELRLAIIILIIILVWFLAWTPYAIVALLGIFGEKEFISPLLSMIPALFCKTAGCIDPFIYAMSHQKFKTELKMMFCNERQEESQRKRTMRISTIQTESQIFKSSLKHQDSCKDGVEEVIIVLDIPKPANKIKECSAPSDDDVVAIEYHKHLDKKPLWWYRPSFTNKRSNIRKFSRTLSTKEQNIKFDTMEGRRSSF